MTKYPKAAMASGTKSGTSETNTNLKTVTIKPHILTQSQNLLENNIIPIIGHKLNENNFI